MPPWKMAACGRFEVAPARLALAAEIPFRHALRLLARILRFPLKDEDSVPVEVKAGSIVFFNGYLLHRSLPNRAASGFRRSLVNHYMSAESFLPWSRPEDGTSMAMADYRDIVMVAGTDPYAYKGTHVAKAWCACR